MAASSLLQRSFPLTLTRTRFALPVLDVEIDTCDQPVDEMRRVDGGHFCEHCAATSPDIQNNPRSNARP